MAGPGCETILADRQECLGCKHANRTKDARIRELERGMHKESARADRAKRSRDTYRRKWRESEAARREEQRLRRRAERDARRAERRAGRLEEEASALKGTITRQRKRSKTITDKNKKLTNMIEAHDNSNTPPSMRGSNLRMRQERRAARNGPARPRGGQSGHRGTTNKPKPNRTVEHTEDRCSCGSSKIKHVGTEHRTLQTRIQPRIEVVKHITHRYECGECSRTFKAKNGLPAKGEYCRNIQGEVIAAYLERMPYRRISKYLARTGVRISSAAIHNMLKTAGTALEGSSQKILEKIRRAKVLHADETSIRLDGRTVWVWVLHDPKTKTTYYAIRPSRGRDVLNELLPGWTGVVVCDGWRVYMIFTKQRCWTHILRKTDDIHNKNKRSRHASEMMIALHGIYDDACAASKMKTVRCRRAAYKRLELRLEAVIEQHRKGKVLGGFIKTLENAAGDLFRFVEDPRIPPTNNAAERALREIVVHRKVRGGIRSKATMSWMANLFSCAETWKARGLDVVAEAAKYV